MPDREHALSAEIALDRYWDALLTGSITAPDDLLELGLAATARRLHELDRLPEPHPAFAPTLWEKLITPHTPAPAVAAAPGLPSQTPPSPLTGWKRATAQPHSMSRIAAAILLILLLAGSAFAALYPLRLWDGERLPLFAPLGTPTVEAEPPEENVLLDLTLTDIPPLRAEGGMGVTRYPPGSSSRERAAGATEVFFIAVGPMNMTVEETSEPVGVFAPGATGAAQPSRLLAVGEDMTLETGTTVVAPPGAIVNLVNQGPRPTTMLDLIWISASNSSEAGGAIWDKSSGQPQELVSPVRIVLRQTILEADQRLPVPDSDNTAQAVVMLDPERSMDLRSFTDGTVINASDEPLEAYVLSVASNAGTATPSATTRGPAGELQFLWDSKGGPDPENLPDGVEPDTMVNPYGVGIAPQGNVWVSDGAHGRFQIFSPDGTFLETWGDPGTVEGEFNFRATHGNPSYHYGDVAFDASGNIYVADTGNFRVQKFASDRSFLRAWGGEGREDGQMLAPGGIAIGADGTVYVSDEGRSDVQMFDSEGEFLGVIGEAGADEGQFSAPAGVAVGPDGDVWVADFGNHRIQRFSPGGDFIATWGSLGSDEGQLHNPNDMAIDGHGRVYVADLNNYRLQVFEPDGRYLAEIGGMGDGPGQFFTPNAVAVDPAGVAYVSDNYRVQAFRLVLPEGDALNS